MSKSIIFILLCFFFLGQIHAQTFKAGVIFGVTASQINGDDDAGFNKPGLEGGLKSLVSIGEHTDLSIEILYSQRGSKENTTAGNAQAIYTLDYVSIPVIFNYRDWKSDDYYKLHFHAGLNYGRLINASLEDDTNQDDFVMTWRENDLSILVGATYFINSKFGLTFRYNRSLTLLYNNNKETTFNRNSLLPYNLSFHGLYMF